MKNRSNNLIYDSSDKAHLVNKVKNLELFDIIYKYTKGKTQIEHYDNVFKKLDNIESILKN